jgi:uncharacterized protein
MSKPLIIRALFAASKMEIRKAENGLQTLAGYAVKWDQESLPIFDSFFEKVQRGAFTNSIKDNNIHALWNHNSDMVLGCTRAKTMTLFEDDVGLGFTIDLPDTTSGRDAGITVSRGDVEGMSFGFNVRKAEWDETNPDHVVRTLMDVDLQEISPTAWPAYIQTEVEARSARDDFADYKNIKDKRSEEQIKLNSDLLLIRKRKLNLI